MKGSRNAPCPCGSGRKYKRCCLAAEQRAVGESRRDDAVGRRILQWSGKVLHEEIQVALEEFGPRGQVMSESELQLFSAWFHNDRELPGGGTPAERFAQRAGMSGDERAVAERIGGARLSIHRVVEVEPGSGMDLIDLIDGTRVRVASQSVSVETVRWDVLVGRVMAGSPPSLWGPVRTFNAAEEEEVLAELSRLASAAGEQADRAGLSATLRQSALELIRFRTPSSLAERSFYTLEGHPMVHARASWRLGDPVEGRARLARFGDLEIDDSGADDSVEVTITAPRSVLLAERVDELPKGALVIEAGTDGGFEAASVASIRIEGSSLCVEAMSELRLERAIETVEQDFGDLLGTAAEREVVAIEQRLAERREAGPEPPHAPPAGLSEAEEQEILSGLLADRRRRWLDEPDPKLGGSSPREAARDGRSDQVLRLARVVENGAARSARERGLGREIDLISELGLSDDLAA